MSKWKIGDILLVTNISKNYTNQSYLKDNVMVMITDIHAPSIPSGRTTWYGYTEYPNCSSALHNGWDYKDVFDTFIKIGNKNISEFAKVLYF